MEIRLIRRITIKSALKRKCTPVINAAFALCLFVYLVAQSVNAQEQRLDPVTEASFGALLQGWSFLKDSPEYPKSGIRIKNRKDYLDAVQNINTHTEYPSMDFPEWLVADDDYIQALHSSYLVWSLAKTGKSVNAPIEEWLNIIIDKGTVVPEHPGYVNGGVEIATLLLDAYMYVNSEAPINTQFLLNYLKKMRQYSEPMFEQVFRNMRVESDVFKETKTLGMLFISLGQDGPGNKISSLNTPPPSMNQYISRRYYSGFNIRIYKSEEYVDWVKNQVKAEDLAGFEFPFPDTIKSDADYLRALHWSYVIWALAENNIVTNAPLLQWIKIITTTEKPAGYNSNYYSGLGGLAAFLLQTHTLMAPTQEEGVKRMLESFRMDGLLPMNKLSIAQYKVFWDESLCTAGTINDAKALSVLLLNIEEVAGDDLERLRLLLSAITHCASWQKLDLKTLWPSAVYEKITELSKDQLPGSYTPKFGRSVREIAWQLRLRGYSEEMPREEALTMNEWRPREQVDIYTERYQYVWASSWIPVLLLFFGSRRRRVTALVSAGTSTSLLAIIFFCANVAGLGHNTGSIKGYLGVIEYCFPFYAALIAFLWFAGLLNIVARAKTS
ncbi:hypothetical protein [Alkalimarinus alittae]|uniref:Uncharacterized protein n=1 Tax=Alkalimarinus alittae TaxID=2961619 RepID=A0ABY6N5Z2_9ALTE|nr:hypothetical protein [Alkalimarinus alittae]UZE97499.1 hypothetical protein NKI27_07075 [Alkalimarinus alittae]